MAARGTGVYISPVYLDANKFEELGSDSDSSSLSEEEGKSLEHPNSRGRRSREVAPPARCRGDLALHGYADARSIPQPLPPPPPPPPKPHQHGYQQCSAAACTVHGRTVPYTRLSLDVMPILSAYAGKEAGRRSLDAFPPYGQQLRRCSFEGLPPLGSHMSCSSMDTAFYAASQRPCMEASSRNSFDTAARRSSIDLGSRSSVDFAARCSSDLMAAHSLNRAIAVQDAVPFEAMHSPSTSIWCNGHQQGAAFQNEQTYTGTNGSCVLPSPTLAGQASAAVFNSSQLYHQQQQLQARMQAAASTMSRNLSAPLPSIQSPNCVQYRTAAQQQQQQQVGSRCMSSPMPSAEYLCMAPAPSCTSIADPHSTSLAAQHICTSSSSSRTTVQQLPVTGRPYSNSFTAGSSTMAATQQQLLQQQELAAAICGMGTCLSCPLPMSLQPQQQQQQQFMSDNCVPLVPAQQQQVSVDYAVDTTVQEMLLKELQLQELVAGGAASTQGSPIPSPTLQQQQQCGFTGAVNVSSSGLAGVIPAGFQVNDPVLSAPLLDLCDRMPDASAGFSTSRVGGGYVNCATSNSILLQPPLQSSQQLPTAAPAEMCSAPLLSSATPMRHLPQQPQALCMGRESAQMKMQQLVAVQQWQHSIEEELLHLLPMA